jgi:anti-anti-sigma regulatory factor
MTGCVDVIHIVIHIVDVIHIDSHCDTVLAQLCVTVRCSEAMPAWELCCCVRP